MAKFDFYNSTRWRKTRQRVINRAGGMCELCGSRGQIAHHLIEVTADNIEDSNIVFSEDNLQLLCRFCHEQIHRRKNLPHEKKYFFDSEGNFVEK